MYEMYFPIITSRFNKNIHRIEKWMSKGILISRLTKIKLGKLCHSSPSAESTAKFKLYRNLFNIVVRNAKKLYYEKTLAKVQSNFKKTWSVLNSAMNKNTSKSSCIESSCVNGVIESDPQKLANCLNVFFANARKC